MSESKRETVSWPRLAEGVTPKEDSHKGIFLSGQDTLINEGGRALEALAGYLESNPEYELAEFFLFENMPVRALLCGEYDTRAGHMGTRWLGRSMNWYALIALTYWGGIGLAVAFTVYREQR